MRLTTIAVLVLLAAPSDAAEFRGIAADEIAASFPYHLSNPVVRVTAISGDGAKIGGSLIQTGVDFDCAGFDCATSAFVWSYNDSSRQPLGELLLNPGARAYPRTVSALSFDGTTALVTYEYRHYESALHANDVVTALRDPINFGQWLWASDMVPGASVVVGSLGKAPFRWSEAHGFEAFAGIDADSGYGPSAISADGSTTLFNDSIVGLNLFVVGEQRRNAIRWTVSDGPSELTPLDGFTYSNVRAVSSDGSIAVGTSFSEDVLSTTPSRATMWIGSQAFPLEPSLGAGSSFALDVSADGKSIVGVLDPTNPQTDAYFIPDAVLWRDGTAHVLEELLSNEYGLGAALEGWSLTSATVISDDGTVIAGQGIAPNGSPSAWVAILTVPEPESYMLAAIATLAIVNVAFGRSSRCGLQMVANRSARGN